jgi:hypothetical protein
MNIAQAIADFSEAVDTLERKETVLNEFVNQEMAKCTKIDDVQGLIQSLPRGYKGVRRLYDRVHVMRDTLNMARD